MDKLLNQIHHMDALELLGQLEPQSVDMILCDLPYGVTACRWDSVIPIEPMWDAIKRVMKPRGAVVLTATQPFTSRLVSSNYEMFKYSMVWAKSRVTDFVRAAIKPLNQHEDILIFSLGTVASKSKRVMHYYPQMQTGKPYTKTFKSTTNRITGDRPNYKNLLGKTKVNGGIRFPTSVIYFADFNHNEHPTQKPVALFEYLIKTYTQAGDLVVDMCVGSGTTAVAARNTGRRFICGDFTLDYVEIARRRLVETDPYQDTPYANGSTQLSLFRKR